MKEKSTLSIESKIKKMKTMQAQLHSLITEMKIKACDLVITQVEENLIHVLSYYIKAEVKSNKESFETAKRYLNKNEANIMKSIITHFDSLYHYDNQNIDFLISNLDKLTKNKMFVVKLKPLTNEMLKPFVGTTLILKEHAMDINPDKTMQVKQELSEHFIEIVTQYRKTLIQYHKHKSELTTIYWYAASMPEETPKKKNHYYALLRKIYFWFTSSTS